MKKIICTTIAICFLLPAYFGCKAVAKAALKYWTKKQVKEWRSKCNERLSNNKLIKNASQFCDCAIDKISEKYHNYDDAKNIQALQIIDEARECIGNKE